ncbi:MAG TPA: type II secretion system protein GspM [Rhodocyclaceae bacterium]|nr:type II secretion system protein GspM [Rhodocyclaceae bacterium]
MSGLRQIWNKMAGRYAAFSLRERRLIAAALVLGPVMAGYTLLVEPLSIRTKSLQRTIDQQRVTMDDLSSQLSALQAQSQMDPDAARKAELAALQKQLGAVDERLKKLQDSLVPPAEMNALLERLLARHSGIHLVTLKTLPPESILGAKAVADGKPVSVPDFNVYRHGVELQLEGSYPEMLSYLSQLEKADKKILWGSLNFSVVEHPKARMTITVHTLGADKAWLAL